MDTSDLRASIGMSFLWGAAINLPWEIAQTTLYARAASLPFAGHLGYCAAAALWDGVSIAAIYGAGVALFRSSSWICRPGWLGWVLTLALSVTGAVLVERTALTLGWWRYSQRMPFVPYLGVGLSPLLQFLLLPPVALFFGTCRWLRKQQPGGE